MQIDPLLALSPIDGRYARSTDVLRGHLSESALIRQRIRIEAAWLLALASEQPAGLPATATLSPALCAVAADLARDPPASAAAAVKALEQRTNHDVKAVEYFVRDQLASAGASPAALELVHFGCTSEDINNLAYARMLVDARNEALQVTTQILEHLHGLARDHASLAMLSRTHGQTASPTTLGKEFANVAARLERAERRWHAVAARGKWNGAVGNFNAQVAAAPQSDWPAISRRFVTGLGLEYAAATTQIEPHDAMAELFDAMARCNTILTDWARDVWGYISLGYFKQKTKPGEVGSSTMPHKVNPIDFENAEGNYGLANALLAHMSHKLPISRWQRDLTDSTVLRNMGVAFGHTVLAHDSLLRGLGKLQVDETRLAADLDNAWEVLAEPIQTVMRRYGLPEPYEQLKAFTRGQPMTRELMQGFVAGLALPEAEKQRLLALTPAAYTGAAEALARRV
jgi:adenylosuccinate lyase